MLERMQRGGAGGGGGKPTKSGFSASQYYSTNATSAGSFLPPAPQTYSSTGQQAPLDIRRPYNGVGKFSVNIFGNRPVTAPTPETKNMPGAFQAGEDKGGILGAAAGILGGLGSIPGALGIVPGLQMARLAVEQKAAEELKGHENEYLQWAQAEAKRLQEEPRDWLTDTKMQVNWARTHSIAQGGSELAASNQYLYADDNLGGLAQYLMGSAGLLQQGAVRTAAGGWGSMGFINRAEELKNSTDQQLEGNTELISIRDAYRKGEITSDQVLDKLVVEGHGLVNPLGQTAPIEALRNVANGVPVADTLLEVGANLTAGMASLGLETVSDPATLLSLGTATVEKLTAQGVARTVTRVAQTAGRRAVLEGIASGTIDDATGDIAKVLARGGKLPESGEGATFINEVFKTAAQKEMSRLRSFVPAGEVPNEANMVKYALGAGDTGIKEGLQAAGILRKPFVSNQHVIGWMQKVENVLDPLSIFGRDGAGRAGTKATAVHLVDGATNGLGKHNIAPVMDALKAIGVSEERSGGSLGTAIANVAQQIGGEAVARLHTRLGIGAQDGLDPIALTNLGADALDRYGHTAESAIRHKVEKIGLLIVPNKGEKMASAVARERTAVADLLTKMYGVASDEAIKATSKMTEGQLGVVRFMWYGNLSDEILNVRKLSLPEAAAAGLSADYVNRLIYLGPTQLTKQGGELLRQAIKRKDYQTIRSMVEKYDLLEWNVSLSQPDKELLDNVRELLDNHEAHLPTAITDTTKMTPAMKAFQSKYGDSAQLGLRSEDIFATGRNADGRIVSVDPFMDYVHAADVGIGDINPPGIVDQYRQRLLGHISGSQVVIEQNRRFVQMAAQEWGLSREQSETMMRLARAEANKMHASTARGLSQEELYHASTKALTPKMREKIGSRELQRLMFFAHEGSLGKVGLSQSFTGKLKSAEVKYAGSSLLGTIAERYYPFVRFRLNLFFQVQEGIETPVMLIARGMASPSQFTGSLTGVRAGLGALVRDEEGAGRRTAFSRARTKSIEEARDVEYQTAVMMDSFARGIRYAGDMAEAHELMRRGSAAAAVAGSSEEGRALTAIRSDSKIARIKTRGQLIAFRHQVGNDMARMLQRESPVSWQTAKAFYNQTGRVGDGEVAVRWFNDMLMRNDPNSAFSAVESHANPSEFFRPDFLGRRTRWSERVVLHALRDELPDKYKDMSFRQLRQRYLSSKDTVVTEKWLDERLRALGADETYIQKTKWRMDYPSEKEFEKALTELTNPEAAAAHMEMHRIEAQAEGLPLIESLADKYHGPVLALDENGVWKDTTLFQLIADSFEKRGTIVVPRTHEAVRVGGGMALIGAEKMPDVSMPAGVAALSWEDHPLAQHTEMVPMSLIAGIKPGNNLRMTDKELASLARDVKANGMNEPIQLTYSMVDHTVEVGEGNHRTAGIVQLLKKDPDKLAGMHVPVTVFVNRNTPVGGTTVRGMEPDEHGYLPRNLKPSQIGIGTSESAAIARNHASVLRDTAVKDLTAAQRKGRDYQRARVMRVAQPELGLPDLISGVEDGIIVARDSEGNVTHRIGGRKSLPNWLEEVQNNMTNGEIAEHADWYMDMRRGFMALSENEQVQATHLLMAFGITQLNTSPVAGMKFMWRVVAAMRSGNELPEEAKHLQKFAGLNGEALKHLMNTGYVSHEGMGQKLIDFVDSLIGNDGRTVPVRGPEGRWGPVAGDIWAKRDVGYLDGKMLNHLKVAYAEQYNVEAVGTKLERNADTGEMEQVAKTFKFTDKKTGESFTIDPKHIGGGAPSHVEYDHIVEFYNDAADYMNQENFLDRNDWTAPEAQALGWFKAKKVMGDETGDPRTAFMDSSYHVRLEMPHPGRVLGGEANLTRQAVVAQVFPEVAEHTARKVLGKVGNEFGNEASRISGVHVVGSTESVFVHPDGRLGSAVNFEIMGALDDAHLFAAALGAVSHQGTVRAVRASSATPTKANGLRHSVELSFPSNIHPEEMRAILKTLAEDSTDDATKVSFFGDADLLHRADGETVIRVVSDEGESLDEFKARMDDTQLEGFYNSVVPPDAGGYARGRYVNPDEPMKPGAREQAIKERGDAIMQASRDGTRAPISALDDDIDGVADQLWQAIQPDANDPLNPDLDANWGGLTLDSHTASVPKPFGEAKGGGPWTTGIGTTKSLDLSVDEATFKQAVRDFVTTNREALERPGSALGVFRDLDGKHMRIDLDVNLLVGNRDEVEAVQLALKRDGGAYDFTTGGSVYLPQFDPKRANTVTRGYAEVVELKNDWTVNPNGEAYTERIRKPLKFTAPDVSPTVDGVYVVDTKSLQKMVKREVVSSPHDQEVLARLREDIAKNGQKRPVEIRVTMEPGATEGFGKAFIWDGNHRVAVAPEVLPDGVKVQLERNPDDRSRYLTPEEVGLKRAKGIYPQKTTEVGRPGLEREAGELEREGVHWGRMVWENAYQSVAGREVATHRISRGVSGDPNFDLGNPAGYLERSPRGSRSARFAADAGERASRLYQRSSGGAARGAITDAGTALSTTPVGKAPTRAQIYVHPRRKVADTLAHEQAHDYINRLLQPSGRRRAQAVYEGREGTMPTIGSKVRDDLSVDAQEWLADQFVEYLRQGPDAVANPALVPLAEHYAKVLKAKRERIPPDLTAYTAEEAKHAAAHADWQTRKAAHDAERVRQLNPQPAPPAPPVAAAPPVMYDRQAHLDAYRGSGDQYIADKIGEHLPPPEAGKVRLYRGEGGGGAPDGNWWSDSPAYAIQYAGENGTLFYADVPASVQGTLRNDGVAVLDSGLTTGRRPVFEAAAPPPAAAPAAPEVPVYGALPEGAQLSPQGFTDRELWDQLTREGYAKRHGLKPGTTQPVSQVLLSDEDYARFVSEHRRWITKGSAEDVDAYNAGYASSQRTQNPDIDKALDRFRQTRPGYRGDAFERGWSDYSQGNPKTPPPARDMITVPAERPDVPPPTRTYVTAEGKRVTESPLAPMSNDERIKTLIAEADSMTGKRLTARQEARMMEIHDEVRRLRAVATTAPENVPDVGSQATAVRATHNKWDQASGRNGQRMEKDLTTLESQGVDVTDELNLLDDYNTLERGDFDSAEEFKDARTDAWNELMDSLDAKASDLADEAAALPAAAAAPAPPEVAPTLAPVPEAPPAPAPVDIGEFPEAPPVPPKKPRAKTREVTLHPDAKELFDTLDKTPEPKNAYNYDMDEQNVLAWMQASHRRADRVSQDLVHFKSDRSWLERSLNHPYFGLYPLSYMWGKILPEMVEFLMFRPFGVKAPGVALTATNKMYQHTMNAIENDPDVRAFMDENEDALRAIAMLVPGVPWDLPVNAPLWLRRYIEGVATNLQKDIEGKQPESYSAWNAFVSDIDYTKIVGDTIGYTAGPKQGAETLLSYPALAGKVIGSLQPTEEEKAAAEAAAQAGTQVPNPPPGVPQPVQQTGVPQAPPAEKPSAQQSEDLSPDTIDELQSTLGDEYQNVVDAISAGGGG